MNYTVSFYTRAQPLETSELYVKLLGEFGNSGEFKTKLFKSLQKSGKLFAKNTLVNFSQKFFNFGKLYKIDITLPSNKHTKNDLASLQRSFIVITYDKQQYYFFFVKNKSIKKEENNMIKVKFYEQVI